MHALQLTGKNEKSSLNTMNGKTRAVLLDGFCFLPFSRFYRYQTNIL